MWYFLISLSNGQPNEMTYPKADSASQNRGTKRTGAKQLPRQTHGLIWSLCPEHHGCLAQMPFKSVQHEGHRSITQLQTFVSNQSAPQLPDDAPPPLPDVIGHMGEVVLCESVGCWLCGSSLSLRITYWRCKQSRKKSENQDTTKDERLKFAQPPGCKRETGDCKIRRLSRPHPDSRSPPFVQPLYAPC